MTVRDLVEQHDWELVIGRPDDTVEDASSLLAKHNIGALPICDSDGKLVGVFSERDVVRAVANLGTGALTLKVGDLMTREVVICTPDNTIFEATQLMSKHNIRHLPVMNDVVLWHIISQRDVLKAALGRIGSKLNRLHEHMAAKP